MNKRNITLLAMAFLVPSCAYAQGFTQDRVAQTPGTKEAVRQGRNPGVPMIATPNPKEAHVPPPLTLSAYQQSMLPQNYVQAFNRHAAALQGATRYNVAPMEISAHQQLMLQQPQAPAAEQPPAQQSPDQQATAQQAEEEYCPGEGATVFDDKGVPHFEPPQYFPQGPTQQPVPISQISVPPPSFPPTISTTGGLISDTGNSGNICDDCPDWSWQDEINIINNWAKGKMWGFIIGRSGDSGQIDAWLDTLLNADFAFQYGFLAGLAAADCDPDFYAELYKKMLQKIQEDQQKQRKKGMDMFNVQPASGGGFGSGGGGPPC